MIKESLKRLILQRYDNRGAIIVMIALMLPLLIGFVGLGVEIGSWFQNKRSIQTIADAAAIGGAYDAQDSIATSTTILSAATTDAIRNGYDATNDTISASNPPSSGSYTSDTGAVEINVTRSVNLLFAGSFLGNSISITARAVARTGDADEEACVLSLDTTSTGVSVSGSGDVTFDGCQVASNSSDSAALSISGSGDLETDCYTVVGGVSDSNGGLTTDSGCSGKTGSAAIADPYESLTAPDEACDENSYTYNNNGGSETITGTGSYTDAYTICGDFWVKNGTVTLSPGLYVIEGDFKTNANGSIQGDDVTIILKEGGQINNINGSSTVNLTAPDTSASAGDWEGILFFQDPLTTSSCTGNNCNTLNGNSSTSFEGVVYFPDQEINVNGGNSASSPCLQLVALRVSFSGNSDMSVDNSECSDLGVSGIALPGDVELVE
jgi:Flp pilus assembly protein TadG